MPVFDLNKYSDDDKLKDNPVMATQDEIAKAAEPSGDTGGSNDGEQATVTIMGPLSSIYADALNKVLGKNDSIGIESTDSQLGTAILMKRLMGNDKPPESAVVYVTDGKDISDDTIGSFNGLRLALDQKDKKYVVIENLNGYLDSSSVGLIENYAHKHADKIFYTRESCMAFFGGRYGKSGE